MFHIISINLTHTNIYTNKGVLLKVCKRKWLIRYDRQKDEFVCSLYVLWLRNFHTAWMLHMIPQFTLRYVYVVRSVCYPCSLFSHVGHAALISYVFTKIIHKAISWYFQKALIRNWSLHHPLSGSTFPFDVFSWCKGVTTVIPAYYMWILTKL